LIQVDLPVVIVVTITHSGQAGNVDRS
jgi:hypothetical protein